MSDYETLKECKTAWEILNDIKDNCELLDDEDTTSKEQLCNRAKINETMDLLSDLYTNAWELIASREDTHKQLETNVVDRFGHKLIISDLIGYAYLCEECDENNYACECEVDKKHYKYEDFDNVEQARDEYIKVFGATREDIEELLNNDNATDMACNELISDIVEELNGKVERDTNLCWWL